VRVALIEILTTRARSTTIAICWPPPSIRSGRPPRAMNALGNWPVPNISAAWSPACSKPTKARRAKRPTGGRLGVRADLRGRQASRSVARGNEELPDADRDALLPTRSSRAPPHCRLSKRQCRLQPPHTSWDCRALVQLARCLGRAAAHRTARHRQASRASSAGALGVNFRVAPLPDKRSGAQRLELLQKALALCTTEPLQNRVLKRPGRSASSRRCVLSCPTGPAGPRQQACERSSRLAHHRDLRERTTRVRPGARQGHRHQHEPRRAPAADRYKEQPNWAKPTVAEHRERRPRRRKPSAG